MNCQNSHIGGQVQYCSDSRVLAAQTFIAMCGTYITYHHSVEGYTGFLQSMCASIWP